MKETLAQLILDFHQSQLPEPSLREIALAQFPSAVRKAYVFVGMRRSGKTWAMYQHMRSLIDRGIDKRKIVYINFEDDRLLSFRSHNFQSVLDAYFELYPQFAESRDVHFFFDEIHQVEGWEKFIRRLLDQEKMSIYISGSSAKMLSKEIASNLRGRTIVREIFPFSFREYLHFKQVAFKERLTTKQQAAIAHHCKDFLVFGGFPEAVSLERQFHRNLLQGYVDAVIYRDIVERYNIHNSPVVRELIKYCLQNSASLLSMNKIYHRFKSQGQMVGKNSLYAFMEYLEDAYCLFSVSLYSFSFLKQTVNPKKIYCIDQGLISAYTIKPEYEQASRLENTVFCQLRRRTDQIFYYKTKTGKEVDFLSFMPNGTKELFQVSVSLKDEKTYARETAGLREAMKELAVKKSTIVTMNDFETKKFKEGVIEQIPAAKWLLQPIM